MRIRRPCIFASVLLAASFAITPLASASDEDPTAVMATPNEPTTDPSQVPDAEKPADAGEVHSRDAQESAGEDLMPADETPPVNSEPSANPGVSGRSDPPAPELDSSAYNSESSAAMEEEEDGDTGWDDSGEGSSTNGWSASSTAMDYCQGYFGVLRKINNTIEFSGYTQCTEPHYLELKIVLQRWYKPRNKVGSWRDVWRASGSRTGYLINQFRNPDCDSSGNGRYRMVSYPKMDSAQMVGWGAKSDSAVLGCKLNLLTGS